MPIAKSKKKAVITTPEPEVPAPSVSDSEHCKSVARQLLRRIELCMTRDAPVSEEEVALRQREHEWFFGSKNSFATTLVLLAELILKIEQTMPPHAAASLQSEVAPNLNPSDIALIESFIRRAQAE